MSSLATRLSALTTALTIAGLAGAQVATGYSFTQSVGTYAPISGGTLLGTATGTSGAASLDDVTFTVALPFAFTFDNAAHSDIIVNSNGSITFGLVAPGTNYTPLSATAAYAGAVSAFGRDIQAGFAFAGTRTLSSNVITGVSAFGPVQVGDLITGTGIPAATTITAIDTVNGTITMSAAASATSTGTTVYAAGPWAEMRHETLGSAPNRVFVVQWQNFKRFGTTLTTVSGMNLNFQIRLHEGSNLVEAVYGACTPGLTTFTTVNQVGLRGPNNTFATNVNNRLNTKGTNDNWLNSVAGTSNTSGLVFNNTAPANVIPNGLTYRWTPALIAANVAFGAGCGSMAASWYEQFAASANDLSGTTLTMAPNGNGGSNVSIAPLSTFVPPTGTGLALTDDSVSAPQSLGFNWAYAGGSTSAIAIDSNGRIFLNGTDSSVFSASVAELLGNTVHTLNVAHTDFLPDGTTNLNNVYFETDNLGEARVTWLNVPCYQGTGSSTLQAVFLAPNILELRYQTLVNDSTSNSGIAIVGFSLGGNAVDPGNRDLTTASPFSTVADAAALSLSAAPAPVLGATVVYTTNNIPATAAFSAQVVSWGQHNPGLPIAGAPGCLQFVDLAGSVTVFLPGSPSSSFPWTVPNTSLLIGAELFHQSASIVPGINSLGLITSNGLRSTISNL